ncbi:unnamed protein product [Spirodela intermedia]|uniref:Uncharacterized protein n=1 Tax=Spirodela intermedia TaxID=51605 RepID=A0A7I8L939_SPIIN|nr:unnamed protein product [Spirodela intermedia]
MKDLSSYTVLSIPAIFFVMVYIERIPIGKELDLFAQEGYEDCLDPDQMFVKKIYVLTYDDVEGDWIMFLSFVKSLNIRWADRL